MKLLIGLGNSGEKYKNNRHNVGFMVLDTLVSQISNFQFPISKESQISKFKLNKKLQSLVTSHQSLIFVKPQTMMNNSGRAVKKLFTHYKIPIPNLWVIHDDLDIKLGDYKIQKGKGPREHNGLLSIYKALGSKDFWHVRVGIENRHSEIAEGISRGPVRGAKHSLTGKDYVLQDFTDSEKKIFQKILDKLIEELLERFFTKKTQN